ADLAAEVTNEVDAVRAVEIADGLGRHRSLGLIAARGVEVTARAAEVVRAALRDHVQLHARGHDARIRTARRHLHLFERVEVEVQRRAPDRAHVGDVDAVHVPGVLVRGRARADIDGLLTRLVAADVDTVDLNSGGLLENRPGVTRGRDLL